MKYAEYDEAEVSCGGPGGRTQTTSSTPSTTRPHTGERSLKLIAEQYGVFTEAIHARLMQGAVDYGDVSLDRPTDELMAEAEQEALDIPGWGFFIWTRIQRLKAITAEIEKRNTNAS